MYWTKAGFCGRLRARQKLNKGAQPRPSPRKGGRQEREEKRDMDLVSEKFAKLGTSVHSVEEAIEAEKLGATYITAGHIYATDCKKGLPPRGLLFLREVCEAVDISVYGIGGIKFHMDQWIELGKCGAIGGCIMSGMMKM